MNVGEMYVMERLPQGRRAWIPGSMLLSVQAARADWMGQAEVLN